MDALAYYLPTGLLSKKSTLACSTASNMRLWRTLEAFTHMKQNKIARLKLKMADTRDVAV